MAYIVMAYIVTPTTSCIRQTVDGPLLQRPVLIITMRTDPYRYVAGRAMSLRYRPVHIITVEAMALKRRPFFFGL